VAATDHLGEQTKIVPRRQGDTRKAPNDPTFHPSRDEAHWRDDETVTGQGVLFDQGEIPARGTLFGAQGKIHPDGGGYDEAANLSRLRPTGERAKGVETAIGSLAQSRVPTAHWSGGQSPIDVADEREPGASGFYRHYTNSGVPLIAVEGAGLRKSATETLIHEMGHAHHYETVPNERERGNPTKFYRNQQGWSPDPLKEGLADAYVDRYGGQHSAHVRIAEEHARHLKTWEQMKSAPGFEDMPDDEGVPAPKPYSHISDRQFGYSSQYEVEAGANATWDDPDRVLYAGVRAHYDATGEHPRYQPSPKASTVGGASYHGTPGSATDATIAMLHQHSEHARAAWENLTIGGEKGPKRAMTDVAAQAVRRHQDRRLIKQGQEIQESLWGEPELAHNQFGERPRTVAEVDNTLGGEPFYAGRIEPH
jgi:hypothetical protein